MSSFESLKLEFIHRIQLRLLMRPPGGGRLSAERWETFAEANKTKSEKGGERVESESFPLGQSDARVRSQVALHAPPLSPPHQGGSPPQHPPTPPPPTITTNPALASPRPSCPRGDKEELAGRANVGGLGLHRSQVYTAANQHPQMFSKSD